MVDTQPSTIEGGTVTDIAVKSFADIATVMNSASLDSVPASYFNDLFSYADSADIFDSTNLTLAKATTIVRDSNLTEANRTEICILKTRTIGFWVTCSGISTARAYGTGAGTQDAGLLVGGYNGSTLDTSEEYDGSSWSGGGTLNTPEDYMSGSGTQSAAFSCGGNGYSNLTENYNGSSWAGSGNLNTGRDGHGSAGTQSAGLTFSGKDVADYNATTEKYDGSIWSTDGAWDVNDSGRYVVGAGTQSDALKAGGVGSYVTTELFNGSAWSTSGNLNTSRCGLGSSIQSGSSSCLVFGGEDEIPNQLKSTEEFNGTSWSMGGNMAIEKEGCWGMGTSTAALAPGGKKSSYFNHCQAYW